MTTLRFVAAWLVAGVALATPGSAQPPAGTGQPISIDVRVPADAAVSIDGYQTRSTGESRRYVTPPLAAGKDYSYTLTVTAGGKTVTRTITVRAGAANAFDLRADFQTAAAPPPGAAGPTQPGALSEEEAFRLGTEAYVYGYPLIT